MKGMLVERKKDGGGRTVSLLEDLRFAPGVKRATLVRAGQGAPPMQPAPTSKFQECDVARD